MAARARGHAWRAQRSVRADNHSVTTDSARFRNGDVPAKRRWTNASDWRGSSRQGMVFDAISVTVVNK